MVKDLFRWIEFLRRSVIIPVVSNTELIFDQGGLGKKNLTRPISSSKISFRNFLKSDFQSCQRLVQMNWGST